jgi:HEAT repeat protein
MERSEADVVVDVAADDVHPLQAVALYAMAFGYDEPSFPPVIVRALRHPSAAVRAAAADVLLWDEPVEAETPLLSATADESPAVAAAAVDTLQYYPSRRVLRVLAELAKNGEDEVRAKAAESLEYNRGRFEFCATSGDPSQQAELREWMAPVSDLVRWTDNDQPRGASSPSSGRRGLDLPERNVLALVSDADGEWAAKKQTLRSLSWTSYRDEERGRLCKALTIHPDPVVREVAATALAAWSKAAELLELASDPHAGVRKSAIYHLRMIPPDRAVGVAAWNAMFGRGGTMAQEALQTYVVHAPAGEAKTRLTELAQTDRRESIRATAVSCLIDLDAAREIERLSPLLSEPPGVSWAVHIRLIDGLRALAVPAPVLDDLALIDNLDLVQSVVALRHSQRA